MQKKRVLKDRCILLLALLILSIGTYSLFGNTKGSYFFDLAAYQHRIQGVVTDPDGVPIQGATVRVKGTSRGTFTNIEGVFYLEATPSDVLVFSYIGFKPLEIVVGNETELSVALEEDVTDLGAVTVNAGYYQVTERERTGNISRITSQTISNQPVASPLAAMQGRMPGVFIQQNTGVPGGSISIRIRGRNSIASGNQPLYIVDGVPLSSETMGASFSNPIISGGNPLDNIDPSTIESIEVLKDADATAIYGSRGANGVVLITTKKGIDEKTNFDISFQSGTGVVASPLPMMHTQEYLHMRREAFDNDYVSPTVSNAPDLMLWETTRYTDWQKELYGRTSFITQAQTAFSGGNGHTHFRLGGNYRKETGVFNGDFSYQKAGANLNLDHQSSNERFRLSLSAFYQALQNDQPLVDPTLNALYAPPNTPQIYTEDGSLNWEDNTFNNPYALMLRHFKEHSNTLNSNVVLEYRLTDKLAIKSNFGYNHVQTVQKGITPLSSLNPDRYNTGEAWFGNGDNTSWIVEPQLSFSTSWAKHRFNILAGATFQENKRRQEEFYTNGYTNDALLENMEAASNIRVQDILKTEYRYQALFARINYVYGDKYIMNLTGRRDGSSRFGPGNQWANFGAVGAAWLFYKEPWLADMAGLSFGKVRASYGTTGNDQISDYGYLDNWTSTTYTYNEISGLYPARLFNPSYGWEVNRKLEAAIDLGFLGDRLMLSAAYYRNRSSNQLVGQPLPITTGFNNIQNNLNAEVENKGWELELHSQNIRRPNFSWNTDILLTLPKNELLKFPNIEATVYANLYVVGEPLSIVKTYKSTGVDPQTGLYQFEDVNGDGLISSPDDRQTIKKLNQDFYGGISNRFRLGNWQLDFLFDFVKQTGRGYQYSIGSAPGYMRNQPVWATERWQVSGDQSPVQRYTQNSTGGQPYSLYRASDAAITDASYIKLRNAALSYRMPEKWLRGTPFTKCDFSLQGQNLLTITGYKGLDPETQSNSVLPPLRLVMAGVFISF